MTPKWISIKGNKIQVAWRTKTTKQQMEYHITDYQKKCLMDFFKDKDFEHLGDFLNDVNREEPYHYLVIAKILWAISRGKKV